MPWLSPGGRQARSSLEPLCPRVVVSGRARVCDIIVGRSSSPRLRFPVILELATAAVAAQSNDGVCPSYSPEHARLFESGSDYGFAARFNYARTDEQPLLAEFGIAHAFFVAFEIIGLGVEDFPQFDVVCGYCA